MAESPLSLCQAREHYPGYTMLCRTLREGANVHEATEDGDTLLHHAAKNGNAGYVIALLAHGADKYITNNEGKTPLDVAVGRTRAYLEAEDWQTVDVGSAPQVEATAFSELRGRE